MFATARRSRALSVMAGAVLPIFAWGPEGIAQELEPGQTILDRPHPEVDPIGVRMGGFLLSPRVTVEEVYDTNIFRTEDDKADDFITVLTPEFSVASQFSRHQLSFNAYTTKSFHADNSDENYLDYGFAANGRLDILRSASLSAGLSFDRLHELRESLDDVNGVEPTKYRTLVGSLGGAYGLGRLTFNLDASVQRFDFKDVEARNQAGIINNDDRDRFVYTVSAGTAYEVSPGYDVFLRTTYDLRDYDDARDDAGFDRDSHGWRVDLGTAFEITAITFGEIFGGYRRDTFDDPAFQATDGFNFGANVKWNVTQLTTLGFTAERSLDESTEAGTSARLRNAFGLSLDHELLRNLIVSARADYALSNSKSSDVKDKDFNAGLSATYLWNRYLDLVVGYQHRRRDSNQAGNDFAAHIFSVALSLEF